MSVVNARIKEYRHRSQGCSRLFFEGYLPPMTFIRIRCPSCGKMHEIRMNTTGILNGKNGHT